MITKRKYRIKQEVRVDGKSNFIPEVEVSENSWSNLSVRFETKDEADRYIKLRIDTEIVSVKYIDYDY